MYFVVGIYLLRVAKEGVKKHPMLLSMNAWALQGAHGLMMALNLTFMPFEGYSLWGLPGNILPFGDIPFIFMLFGLNIYLFKKVFGTVLP